MPSGKPVHWANFDHLFEHLPQMTIEEFAKLYLPDVSSKAVGARARKLGIKPLPYRPTTEHKAKISEALNDWTDEQNRYLLENAAIKSVKQLASDLNVDDTAVWRQLHRLGYEYIPSEVKEKHRCAVVINLARPEIKAKLSAAAKGRILSDETKVKIGVALSGEGNGQYGRGMTEEEKDRWRKAFFSDGIHKIRKWLNSEAGKVASNKALIATTSKEYREAASKRIALAIKEGRLTANYYGNGKHLSTAKGGDFYAKSSYEIRYVKMLEDDDTVVSFVYEPFSIEYEFEGITLNYIPDFLVRYVDRDELVEVKPKNLLKWPKNMAKFEAGKTAHINFKIVTENELK